MMILLMNLDSWVKANVLADNLAEEHMTWIQEQPPPTYRQRKEDCWVVNIEGKIITSKFDQALTLH